MKSLSGDKGSV